MTGGSSEVSVTTSIHLRIGYKSEVSKLVWFSFSRGPVVKGKCTWDH